MSLDVYLTTPNEDHKVWSENYKASLKEATGLKGLTPLVEDYYKDREPDPYIVIYRYNITHNLGQMARECGLYKLLWRPEELGFTKAKQLIVGLKNGLHQLKLNPDYYRKFNPSNGWGKYEQLISFVETYLQACIDNPECDVMVNR